MAVPLAVSCPRSRHACHVIRSRYRISMTSPEGRLAWRPREGCGLHQGRIGRRSAIPSGAGGIGVLPSSPFQRRPYWSGRRPSPSTAAACPGPYRGFPAGPRASAPRCTRAASYRPGVEDVGGLFAQPQPAEPCLGSIYDRSGSSPSYQRRGVMTVPPVRVNSCRWLRSQRTKASSIAVASCSNLAERDAIKTRPGRGRRSPVCGHSPPTRADSMPTTSRPASARRPATNSPTHTEPDHDHVSINRHYRPFRCAQ